MVQFPTLSNRRILLGVTGGIAAYKAADLVRRLRDQGAEVRVVMTPAAVEFVAPLTFQALSGWPVHTTLLDADAEAGMGHIELARWSDRILVVPASADFLARLAQGQANDLLSAVCLASIAPMAVVPAMNQAMWRHAATSDNLSLLRAREVDIWGPADGSQACGDVGPGRMLEVADIVERLAASFEAGYLAGLSVVITAGPTREAIDPVRYISNHSSGKMGYALARAAVDAGARVTLVSGPVGLDTPERLSACFQVTSAIDMQSAVMACIDGADIFIAAAAVADYRPKLVAEQKIKKNSCEDEISLELVRNPDIVASVAALARRPFVVGFAAETESLLDNAKSKLIRKSLDAIVANDVSRPGLGFNSDQNAVQLIWGGGVESFEAMGKNLLASKLLTRLAGLYKEAQLKKHNADSSRHCLEDKQGDAS
jgi:phosphopantothenoylcysteine decarboxylase/phosphopantothenate--cysteine ligase